MTLMLYLIKMVLVSGILLTYYICFLRNRSFHGYNRFFLLGSGLLSLVIPLIRIPAGLFAPSGGSENPIRLLRISAGEWEEAVQIGSGRQPFTLDWQVIGISAYVLITLVLLLSFIRSVEYLRKLSRSHVFHQVGTIRCYETREPGTPFSFFHHIFWNGYFNTAQDDRNPVFLHEKYHVDHRHSSDRIFFQLLTCFCWFNPFFFLMQKEIRVLHEFLADEYASQSVDRFAYAEKLLMPATTLPITQLPNSFFSNQLKRRIAMIMKKNQPSQNYISRLLILPLLFLVFIAFGFHFHPQVFSSGHKPGKMLTVVIDPGHGGSFSGATVNGVEEKDLNLSIARAIQRLAPAYGVQVVMTREGDASPGHISDLHEDLVYRTTVPAASHADLFISIHINSSDSGHSASGFEIYIPPHSNKIYDASVVLGSAVSGSLGQDFSIAHTLKEREERIYVLNHATVPAILVCCGYMNNPDEFRQIIRPDYQEKIARDILQGIAHYQQQDVSAAATDQSKTTVDVPSNQPTDTGIRKKVEVEAEYPGGRNGWNDYLLKNLVYPKQAIDQQVQGQVLVEFVVDSVGNVRDVHCVSGPVPLQKTSIDIVSNSGRWTPAMDQGKAVSSWKMQPMVYHLQK